MSRAVLPAGIRRGPAVTITVDGEPVRTYVGETVAAALIAQGAASIGRTRGGASRGLYCGMGVCFDCLVMVDGRPNTRACMTWVCDGMAIRRMDGFVAVDIPRGER